MGNQKRFIEQTVKKMQDEIPQERMALAVEKAY